MKYIFVVILLLIQSCGSGEVGGLLEGLSSGKKKTNQDFSVVNQERTPVIGIIKNINNKLVFNKIPDEKEFEDQLKKASNG